jgi:hypothetical protein
MRIWPKARSSRVVLWMAISFVLYSVGTYFGVPALSRYVARNQVSIALHRQVSIGKVSFNPYKLRLLIANLRVAEHDGSGTFVDIGRIKLRLSWTSLYRLALVVKAITVDHPSIHVVRTAPQTFNFSDLIQPTSTSPPQQPRKPAHFAISNLQLNNGRILFDDQVLKRQHRVDKIQLDIPFVANLPTDVDIYVRPFLRITVDGSPFAIAGRTRPFVSTRESVFNVEIHRLDLTQYIDYVPVKLPVKVAGANLSTALQVSFIEATDKPEVRVNGTIGFDGVAVRDRSNAPLLEMKTLQVSMANVEPFNSIVHLSSISIDSLAAYFVLNHDGTTNLSRILSAMPAGQPTPPASSAKPVASPLPSQTLTASPAAVSSSAVTASPAATPSPALGASSIVAAPVTSSTASASANSAPNGGALQLSIDSIQLDNSGVDVNDLTGVVPVPLKLQAIHAGVANFSNTAIAKPASYDVKATLAGGGQITAGGNLNLAGSQATLKLGLNQIDIPALQGLAQSALAGVITSGKLSANATVNAGFAPARFNVSAQPSEVAIDGFAVHAPNSQEDLIGWKHFDLKLASADLLSRNATLQEVRSDGLQVMAERDRHGKFNLLSLIHMQPQTGAKPFSGVRHRPERRGAARLARSEQHSPPRLPSRERHPTRETVAEPTAPGWRYKVELVALENTQATLVDRVGGRRTTLQVAPLNINLKGISNDLAKPIGVELDGRVNRKGTFKIGGSVVVQPLETRLRIETRRVELASLDPFVTSQLNTRITRLELTMKGETHAAMRRNKIEASYRGGLALGNVRIVDKLSGEDFLNWYALYLDRMDLRYGAGRPRVLIGAVALSNFYSRIILNSNGQLNLRDVMINPQKAPVSLTRAHGALPAAPPASASPSPAATATPTPAAAAAATPAPAPSPIPANIAIGAIALKGGQIDYTDNFIKPNYAADLTEVEGTVGSFGTQSTQPADVSLSGKVNGSSPITISGSINPLTPLASLDIKANASGVELTPLAAYTTKYTGYPIIEGTLTVDVHYLLANQQLTAQNHIILDQFTFGDRVANSTARNLPVRLAVALLKDSNGRINLNIPVSGSLSDPQFSIVGVIWGAVENLLLKAVTSPFSLIASLGGGANENLSYVEFAPGYATLTHKATAKLDTVAKALQQKSSLKLIITGAVDPALDREALREAMLDYAIRRRKAGIEGSASTADLDQVKVTPDEYNKYLRRVYKAADFNKPQNFMRMTKSLPPDQMKKLILANTKVTDEDLRDLANARAKAVSKQLSQKVNVDRLQTVAPRLNANGSASKTPTTVADLSLQ